MEFLELLANMSIWSAIFLVSGLVLIVVEMFHPGFGAAGISGIILLAAGVLVTAKTWMQGIIMTLILLVILAVLLSIALYLGSKGKLPKSLVLKESTDRESGFSGTDDMQYLLGKKGIAITPLRPSGCADLDGIRLDVVTRGDFIDKDTPVTVVEVEGNRIVVARSSSSENGTSV